MHTLSTGIHISNLLRIKLVTGFPSALCSFAPPSSPYVPSLQTELSLVVLAVIGEIHTAFEPDDPQAIKAARPSGKVAVPGLRLPETTARGACPPGRANNATALRNQSSVLDD